MTSRDDLREQLDSLHAISVEIAALNEMSEIHDLALTYCLELTASEFAFTGLLVDGPRVMDVAAIKGFQPVDVDFYEQFHLMAVGSSVVAVTIEEKRSYISNDVLHDPHRAGMPTGHPPVRNFLGVPLQVGKKLIGMIGVANKAHGYSTDDERILATFANQVAVAIENARLYEGQRDMIASLQQLHGRLDDAAQSRLLARERERIAGELHDQIEQEVFSIGLRLNALLESKDLDESAVEQLRAIRQLAVATAGEVRRAIFALAAPGEERGDLVSQMRSLLRDLERRSELQTHLVVSGSVPRRLGPVHDVLISVVKEALSNVERHAGAGMVLVSIRCDDPGRLHVVIQDDGVGISALILNNFQDSYLHFGLRHMRRQILEVGGEFEIANSDADGTTVRMSIPLSQDPA